MEYDVFRFSVADGRVLDVEPDEVTSRQGFFTVVWNFVSIWTATCKK